MTVDLAVAGGILLPEGTLDAGWFVVLAGAVAVSAVVYVTLSLSRALPRVRLRDRLPRRYARRETRSIYPDAPR